MTKHGHLPVVAAQLQRSHKTPYGMLCAGAVVELHGRVVCDFDGRTESLQPRIVVFHKSFQVVGRDFDLSVHALKFAGIAEQRSTLVLSGAVCFARRVNGDHVATKSDQHSALHTCQYPIR